MPVDKSKVRIVDVEEDTIGGDTYIVKLPGERDEKSICFRRIHKQPGMRCANLAGFKTNHLGTGACAYHGGNNNLNPRIVTGRNAKSTKLRLNSQIEDYLQKDRKDLLDMTGQLAATRAIFDDFLTTYPEPESDDYGLWFGRFQGIVGTLGTLVDKITKIDSRNSLTAAQVLYIRATMVDLFLKYITDPIMREKAIKEMASRMGGDVEVTMKPSEIAGMSLINE